MSPVECDQCALAQHFARSSDTAPELTLEGTPVAAELWREITENLPPVSENRQHTGVESGTWDPRWCSFLAPLP